MWWILYVMYHGLRVSDRNVVSMPGKFKKLFLTGLLTAVVGLILMISVTLKDERTITGLNSIINYKKSAFLLQKIRGQKSGNIAESDLQHNDSSAANLQHDDRKCIARYFPKYHLPGKDCLEKVGLRPLCVENLVHSAAKPVNGEISISIVTQLSCERLDLLRLLAQRWKHYISAVLFHSDSHICSPDKIESAIDFAKEHGKMELNLVRSPEQKIYPFNALRYLASDLSITSHLLYLDTDLMPCPDLYNVLMAHLVDDTWVNNTTFTKKPVELSKESVAFVVPAFDYVHPDVKYRDVIVKDREHLLDLWNQRIIKPIRIDVWYPGHGPTNFSLWRKTKYNYEVNYAHSFEPYVLVPRTAPKPDIRFVGAEQDKIAFILQLHSAKFRFVVVRDGFTVHMVHAKSLSKSKVYTYKSCINSLYRQLAKELQSKKR